MPARLLATAGLGALTWGLTLGSGPARAGRAAALARDRRRRRRCWPAFLWVERGAGDRAMMPLALFGSRSFVGLTLLTFLLYGALGALLVLLPFVLIQAAGYSATAAGAALLPFPLVLALASPLMGGLAGRIGARAAADLGPLVVAAGFLLAMRIGARRRLLDRRLPAMLVIAIGMAGAVAPLTTAVLARSTPATPARPPASTAPWRRTGGLIATALLGAVLAAGPRSSPASAWRPPPAPGGVGGRRRERVPDARRIEAGRRDARVSGHQGAA